MEKTLMIKVYRKTILFCKYLHKGLYINYIILFWVILDPPSPLSSRHLLIYPPPPLDDVIYVQDNRENVWDKIKSRKEDDRFGSLTSGTLHYLYELPFLILILSVFLALDSSKNRPFLVPYGRTPPHHLSSVIKVSSFGIPPPPPQCDDVIYVQPLSINYRQDTYDTHGFLI